MKGCNCNHSIGYTCRPHLDHNPVRTWVNRIAWVLIIGSISLATCLTYKDAHSAEPTNITIEQAVEQYEELKATASLKQTAEILLVKLINAATATGEFIADQVPLVIQELLFYKTAVYIVLLIVGLSLLGAGAYWSKFLFKWQRALPDSDGYGKTDKRDVPLPVCLIACVAMYLPGSLITLLYLSNLLKITLAPRVWLIEYAANLVK